MGLNKKHVSKRMPLHKKYKIKRKITEHHRKARRAARKNPGLFQEKLNRDPGIPNTFPLKEQMITELQIFKQKRMDERKEAQDDARHRAVMEKRLGMGSGGADVDTMHDMMVDDGDESDESDQEKNFLTFSSSAAERVDAFLAKQQRLLEKDREQDGQRIMSMKAKLKAKKQLKSKSERYLDHAEASGTTTATKDSSVGAYYKEFKKVVEASDIILEVLDARDPIGCRCLDVEQTLISKYPNKKVVLVLNKIDLVPKHIVEGWIKYLRNEQPTIAFKCSLQKQKKNISQKMVSFNDATQDQLSRKECLGADTLLQLLKGFASNGKIKTSITVGVIGYPNTGKSSLINSLCRARSVTVGGTPGVTKVAQEVKLDKHVKLFDTPGIVFPKANEANDDVILRNVVKLTQVEDPIGPVEKICTRVPKEQLMQIYQLARFDTPNEFLVQIARQRGLLRHGGIPNTKEAARVILNDWTKGIIPFYTEPPALREGIHVGASVVTSLAPTFDWDQKDTLRSLPDAPSSVSFSVNLGPAAVKSDDRFLNMDGMDEDDQSVPPPSSSSTGPAFTFTAPTTSSKPNKGTEGAKKRVQDLADEADKFNPQTNKNKQKALKQQKKKSKKFASQMNLGKQVEEDDNAPGDGYSFSHFGVPPKQLRTDSEGDIEIADIE